MKKITVFIFCLVLAAALGNPFTALAATDTEEVDASVDFSDTFLSPQESAEFNQEVADNDGFIEMVTAAAQKKGKDVSLEEVHPDKNIKLFGFKDSEDILQSLYDTYAETGAIQDRISENGYVVILYVNGSNEYVDALSFSKDLDLPGVPKINGWMLAGSGGVTSNEEFLIEYAQEGNLKKYVKGLGLKNTNHLKVISSIPHMPACLYFVQKKEEFLLPLEDGLAGIKASQVYRVSDIVENFLKPILDFQKEVTEELAKEHPGEIIYGAPQVPEYLPLISAVDLHTYFEPEPKTVEPEPVTVQKTVETNAPTEQSPPASQNPWLISALCWVFGILIIGGIAFMVVKRRRADR